MDPHSKPSDILMDDTRAEVIHLATKISQMPTRRPAASLPVGAALLSALGFGQCSTDDLKKMKAVPSGEHTKSNGKWPFIVDFPIKNGDFPLLC